MHFEVYEKEDQKDWSGNAIQFPPFHKFKSALHNRRKTAGGVVIGFSSGWKR
jgi:hypothetical protein